jgi:hypothetical protein
MLLTEQVPIAFRPYRSGKVERSREHCRRELLEENNAKVWVQRWMWKSQAGSRTACRLVPIYRSQTRLSVCWQTEGDSTIGAAEYRPHVSGQLCNRLGTSSRRSACEGSNVERDRILRRNERNLASRVPSALQPNLIGVVGSWVASQTVGTHLGVAAMVTSHTTVSYLFGLQSANGRMATAFQFEVKAPVSERHQSTRMRFADGPAQAVVIQIIRESIAQRKRMSVRIINTRFFGLHLLLRS